MNFDLSEEEQVVAELAQQLFSDLAQTERVKEVEEADGFDRDLWQALADVGLLGLCLPQSAGGSGMQMVALAQLAQAQGRHVAPVPLVASITASMAIAEHLPAEAALLTATADGSEVVTAALAEAGANNPWVPTVRATIDGESVRLVGTKPAVPALPIASHVLVSAVVDGRPALALVDTAAEGVTIEALRTTNHEPQGHLTLDTAIDVRRLVTTDGALDGLLHRVLIATSAVQLGVCEGAVAHAAAHVSTREQFGRPLSAFQAVTQRAADAYIATEALRSTVLNAAWQIDNGDDPTADVLSAAYWASEGTQKVVLAAQHLHGGLGSDVDYPVHRHFLWGMQLGGALGSATAHLARLGHHIATSAS